MQNLFHKLIAVDQNILTVILITIFFTIEQFLSRPPGFKKSGIHFLHGIPLQVGYMAVSYALASVFVLSAQWVKDYHFGVFNQIQIPFAAKIIAGLLCIDFTFYWAHRLYHTWALPWRLHRVHHSDTNVDSATFFRFHPFDAVMDTTTIIIASALFGIDISIVTLFFLINLVFTIAQHSKFVFPKWTDSILGKVFMTPNLHKIHHHQNQFYTDSNFGLTFIIWDRIFGTYKYLPVKQIKYGLQEFDDNKKQTFWYLLICPFKNIERVKKPKESSLHVVTKNNNLVMSVRLDEKNI